MGAVFKLFQKDQQQQQQQQQQMQLLKSLEKQLQNQNKVEGGSK
ncbi:hypothetical protein [Ferrovum myxofaciens]|nr:hypothetical protein [Ferrovum myxofaciens]